MFHGLTLSGIVKLAVTMSSYLTGEESEKILRDISEIYLGKEAKYGEMNFRSKMRIFL